MNFNDRLADLGRKRGLSQEQLGYELGVSREAGAGETLRRNLPTPPSPRKRLTPRACVTS